MKEIKFYHTDKPYGCFSNFAKYPIVIEGKEWPTTEHFFQAQKFSGTLHEEEIRNAKSAMDAAIMGRDRMRPLRADWEENKNNIMRVAVRAKVNQHPNIKDILLSTGSCNLIEHTLNDRYWGDNGDGTGKNMLGKILMEIRGELKEFKKEFYLPQWLAYPDIHPYDMFWRMGEGETYVMNYAEWYYNLSEVAQNEYDAYFTAPEEWKNIK